MPGSKPEDTQAMSAAEIKSEGLRPRTRNTNNQQSVAVQITALIMIGAVAISFLVAVVVILLHYLGR